MLFFPLPSFQEICFDVRRPHGVFSLSLSLPWSVKLKRRSVLHALSFSEGNWDTESNLLMLRLKWQIRPERPQEIPHLPECCGIIKLNTEHYCLRSHNGLSCPSSVLHVNIWKTSRTQKKNKQTHKHWLGCRETKCWVSNKTWLVPPKEADHLPSALERIVPWDGLHVAHSKTPLECYPGHKLSSVMEVMEGQRPFPAAASQGLSTQAEGLGLIQKSPGEISYSWITVKNTAEPPSKESE